MSGLRNGIRARSSYPALVLLTALAGMFATTFPITILTVSLGDIAKEFGVSEALMTWVISAPLLASAMALPVLGKLGDLYGHRRVFLAGFAAATITAAATTVAWSAGSLIALRTVAQVIGAATQPTSMALIAGVYEPGRRAKALGWWSLVAAAAPTVGLVAGGPAVEAFGWRLVFAAQAVFAAGAFAVAVVVLRETPTRRHVRIDVAGAASLTVAAGCVMVVLSRVTELGFTHPAIVASSALTPLALYAFVRAERRTPDPLLSLDYLGRRNYSGPLWSALFAGGAYMGGFILAPLVLRFEFGYSIAAVALVMVLRPLSYSISSPIGGHAATRFGERPAAVGGTLVLCAALVLFAAGAAFGSIAVIGAALVLQGVGHGLSRPALTTTLVNAASEADLGITAAAERMAHQVGSAFGIALLSSIYVASSFGAAYLAGAGLAAVAAVAAWFISPDERRPPPDQAVALEAGDWAGSAP